MGIFDFLKPKKKGINQSTFNTRQFQIEIMALAQTVYFENNHDYSTVKKQLTKEGLNDIQCDQIIENLKKVNSKMVNDFQNDLDSGRITHLKIKPNPKHKKGKVDKDQVDKYIGFGAYQMERGELENALELFDKAIELDDKATLAYANKGTLYIKRGNNEKALEFYNKALVIEPNHVQILENKMDLLTDMMRDDNDEKEFFNVVNTILKNDPYHPNALIYIIQKHLINRDIESALISLKDLFKNYHSENISIRLLLQTFNEIQEKKIALSKFDDIKKGLNKDAQYQIDYCKALHLKGLNDFDEAIELFESLNNEQLFSWNYYQIGIIKNLQGKQNECFEYLKKTFELEPELKKDAKQYPELKNLWNNPKFIELTK